MRWLPYLEVNVMAIIGESASERHNREAQKDDARRAAHKISELTGEPEMFLDEFTYDPRWLRALPNYGLDRIPKCLKPKPLKPKEKK